MFIINALMTVPVAIAGVFLSDAELKLAVFRLKDVKADTTEVVKESRLTLIKRITTDWKIYILTFWAILFWNSGSTSYGGYLLWLKSLKRFSTPKVNQLGTTAPALGILYVLFVNFSSDLLWGPSGAIAFAHAWNFTAMVILATWKVPEAAKWFAFNSAYTQVAMSSVLYGWANDILRHNTAERSFIIVFMNLVAQSTTAWTGILAFPTKEGPRFLKGWTFCAVCSVLLVVFTYAVIGPLAKKLDRKHENDAESTEDVVSEQSSAKAAEQVIVSPDMKT
jgi:hypothetical protein